MTNNGSRYAKIVAVEGPATAIRLDSRTLATTELQGNHDSEKRDGGIVILSVAIPRNTLARSLSHLSFTPPRSFSFPTLSLCPESRFSLSRSFSLPRPVLAISTFPPPPPLSR
ncbi:hypothetical protein TIFTF001_025105 [Ficus carica]|uniref:Uncharacterized protein n=1 Tax=Ficus carica TaxID=3494 RepID=A0AA88B151_FICCA|nr:hypothetical protein TIFTF001_025105 [Ficus carica]